MANVFKFRGKARVISQIEKARANFNAAVSAFERAVSDAGEQCAPPTTAELEMAKIDGWLEAIRAVSATPMLEGKELVRRALIDELEWKLHRYADGHFYNEPPTEVDPPVDANTGTRSE